MDSSSSLLTKQTLWSSRFRWIALLMLFLTVFSMIYCYDQLFSLQNQLQDAYDLSPLEYNLLYSIYGYVNIVLPLVSSILIDYIGINASSLLFYTFAFVGNALWIVGCINSSYAVMMLGRGIFACGTQPFHQSRKYYLGKHFIGKEYLFASGLTISASRMASAVSSAVAAQVYLCCGLIMALSVPGQILLAVSWAALIAFIVCDRRITKQQQQNTGKSQFQKTTPNAANDIDESGFFLLQSLKHFDKRFWILSCALGAFYASYMTFTANQSSFLQSRFGYAYETANDLSMIAFWIATLTAPLFGFFCDKYGRKLLLLNLSAVLLIAAHSILGFSDYHNRILPIIGLILFGFAMSIGSAVLWPVILLVVNKKYHASALGVCSAIDNATQATSLVIAGALTKNYTHQQHQVTDQYEYFTWWVLSLAVAMLILTFTLSCIMDEEQWSENERAEHEPPQQETAMKETPVTSVSMQHMMTKY